MENLKRILLSFTLMMACMVASAQKTVATGTIVDENGLGVIGATVMEKSTANGTVTDLDGNFKLEVRRGATLVISYIGYQTIELAAAEGMKVTLKENVNDLNEVIVTGYTTQRKADLTGAVSAMDMKGAMSEADPNVLSSMQGKLAGVDIVTDAAPGSGSSSIRVRGMSTINANNPLYIIDGVATTENLNSLNPADIESIQVLKDASSASIYGSRAANGVIIITTKKGKGNRLTVNVNYSASLQTMAKTYDMLNAQQWGEAYWAANKNAGVVPSHPFYGSGDTPKLLSTFADGTPVADTDWQDEVYSSAWTHNLNASVQNSSERGSMLFSGNFINQDGLMNETFFRRYSVRVNSDYNISKFVKVGENLMVSRWNNRGYGTQDDRGIPYTAMRQHPAIPVYMADGTFANPMKLASSDIANPVHELYNGRDNDNASWRIFGNGYLEVYPVKGLTLKSNLGYEHVQYNNKTLNRKMQPSDITSLNRAYGEGDTWTWTNTANYILDLNDKHHFNFLFGTEAIKYKYDNIAAFRNQFAFEDVDYMQLDAGEGTQTNGGGQSEWALFSLFGKVDYNFMDRYLLSATLRRDQTSRLHKDNNSGIFPAFSAAWRVSEENFFPRNEVVNDLKLRLAWGQNGNSAISNNYASYTTYAYDQGNGAYDLNGTNNLTMAGLKAAATGNKDLKWETTTQTNIGFDASLFDQTLSMTFDYYWKNTRDMLTIPPTLSVAGENAAMWMNTGNMENHGWELNLGYHSPKYGDFSWDGNLNLSQYKNKVKKLNDFVSTIGGDFRLIEGEPMGVYYGYIYDGIFQSDEQVANHAIQEGKDTGRMIFRDLDGKGSINEADRTIIGDPNPDLSLGLSLDFNYKNWTLSTFFSGEFGFDIYNTTKRQLLFMSYGGTSTNRSADILKAWSTNNTSSDIPALSVVDKNNEMRMSNYYIEDGSYLKMKYIKLAYRFPQSVLQALHVTALSVYGQMENVFTITGYDGLDPEVPIGGYGARIDMGPYPRSRTFTLGVNLTF
ncbi:TonB-dependent receptor [Hallella bergensis]|uniref:SusC/RagA family TonB-linked outer membrane protein n=1 Tax=Hallella bergensis TaxID=242750 RepID=UPI0023F058BA|nr:TonB-dependent receptor [Hallella bergensis]